MSHAPKRSARKQRWGRAPTVLSKRSPPTERRTQPSAMPNHTLAHRKRRGRNASDIRPQGTKCGCGPCPAPIGTASCVVRAPGKPRCCDRARSTHLAAPGMPPPLQSPPHRAFDQHCPQREHDNNECATRKGGCARCSLGPGPLFHNFAPPATPTKIDGLGAALVKSVPCYRRGACRTQADNRWGNNQVVGRGWDVKRERQTTPAQPLPQSKYNRRRYLESELALTTRILSKPAWGTDHYHPSGISSSSPSDPQESNGTRCIATPADMPTATPPAAERTIGIGRAEAFAAAASALGLCLLEHKPLTNARRCRFAR